MRHIYDEFVAAAAPILDAREAPLHLGEHDLVGSISPPAAQRFVAAMNDESARGEQYRLVLPGELSARFAREFESTSSTACRATQCPPVSGGL